MNEDSKCDCIYCKNKLPFNLPDEIIDAQQKEI
jgi:hypothetical protein